MQIMINGNPEDIAATTLTIAGLLEIKEVESPDMVSVQLNGAIIERPDYETTAINASDEIEFLYFMGGGAL